MFVLDLLQVLLLMGGQSALDRLCRSNAVEVEHLMLTGIVSAQLAKVGRMVHVSDSFLVIFYFSILL